MATTNNGTIRYVFILFLTISECLASTPCSTSQPLVENCQCRKGGAVESEHRNKASLQCSNMNLDTWYKALTQIHNSGDIFYQVKISDTNLEGIENFPEHFYDSLVSFEMDAVRIPGEMLPRLLEPLTELVHLKIDNDRITVLSKDLLLMKPKLQALNLNNNQMEKIEDDAFAQVADTLKSLSIEGNMFQKIPPAVYQLNSLEFLSLKNNPIVTIHEEDLNFLRKNRVKLSLNSLDCSCEAGKSSFIKYLQETGLSDVQCGSPERLKDSVTYRLTNEHFCGRNSASALVASFSLLTLIQFFYMF